jgi:hypothetical protein
MVDALSLLRPWRAELRQAITTTAFRSVSSDVSREVSGSTVANARHASLSSVRYRAIIFVRLRIEDAIHKSLRRIERAALL